MESTRANWTHLTVLIRFSCKVAQFIFGKYRIRTSALLAETLLGILGLQAECDKSRILQVGHGRLFSSTGVSELREYTTRTPWTGHQREHSTNTAMRYCS
jgi:hypothetical protein